MKPLLLFCPLLSACWYTAAELQEDEFGGTYVNTTHAALELDSIMATTIAIGDMNLDGKEDVIAGEGSSGDVVVYDGIECNNGCAMGTRGYGFPYESDLDSTGFKVWMPDIDGDGAAEPTVSACWVDGGDHIVAYLDLEIPLYWYDCANLDLANGDFDDNGVKDLAMALGGDIYVVPGPIDGPVNVGDDLTPAIESSSRWSAAYVYEGDIDGDGQSDIVSALYGTGEWGFGIYLGPITGALTLDDSDVLIDDSSSDTYLEAVGNFDGDDDGDLIIRDTHQVTQIRSVLGSWTEGQITLDVTATSVAVGDLDGDGADELVVGDNHDLYLFRGGDTSIEDATLTFRDDSDSFTQPGLHTAAIGDVDGDGINDLLFSVHDPETVVGFLGSQGLW